MALERAHSPESESSAPQDKMTGALALIRVLEDLGVSTIFGYPGGANLPIYDALCHSPIRHILARHEQGAALMADGYARVSGKAGVCLATSGPGVTNIITGLSNAQLDSSPLVAITGQIPMDFVGSDAFQEVDTFNLSMPVTKHNELVVDAQEIVPATRSAFHIAETGRKGAVLIDFPRNVLLEKHDFDLTAERSLPGYNPNTGGHIGQIRRAIKTLRRAHKPLILVGGGVVLAQAESLVDEFVSLTNLPLVRTLMGKGVLPEEHPNYVGMIGTHGTVAGNKAIAKADAILALGTRFGDRSTFMKKEKFAAKAKIIHVDIDPAEIGKTVPAYVPIVGDLCEVLQELIDELKTKPVFFSTENQTEVQHKHILDRSDHAGFMEIIFTSLSNINEPLHITTDVGRHQMWATHYCRNPLHLPLLTSGGLGTMGFGLPAAIGAWFHAEDRSVVNITGDGSFYMNLQEFSVAVEYNIPLVVLLINDYRLGMIKELQDARYGKRHIAHDFNRETDFVAFAESFGGSGINVYRKADIFPSIARAIANKAPTLVNFDIERMAASETIREVRVA